MDDILDPQGRNPHGHCGINPKKWEKTLEREKALRELGFEVESITSCEWEKDPRSEIWYEL